MQISVEDGNRRNLDQLDHLWLLTWKSEDPYMGPLVKNLKGGGLPKTFSFLAQNFLSHRILNLPQRATLVYPSKGRRDHGWAWARSIAEYTGLPTEALILLKGQKQALKSRKQRESIQFKTRKLRGPLIFVDDVVTSGATAKAAFRALGRPKNFAIWSIFYRPSL